jgi:hypothetical protein
VSRRVADYVAVAVIAKPRPGDDDDFFARAVRTATDFSGDLSEFKAYAQERTGIPLSDEIVAQTVRVLADCGLLRVTDDNFSGTFVKVRATEFSQFIEKAKAELSRAKSEDDELGVVSRPSDYPNAAALMKHELLEDYHELGDGWIQRALEGLRRKLSEDGKLPEADESVDEQQAVVPAADRLVTIDHNSQAYEELVEKTEAASENIRSSNSIDEERRSWIRVHLSAGLEFIKNNKILAGAASALLLKPLLNAYEAVTEEPAKQAILAAIDAIRTFFGL